jgi:hypothetical protein
VRGGTARHRDREAGDGDQHRPLRPGLDQQPRDDGAAEDRHERPHLDQAVAAGELGVLQVLRQVGVLDRAE